MHCWGDKWEYWEDLGLAIQLAEKLADEAGLPTVFMKEKWGCFRWNYMPNTETDKKAYRHVYEEIVKAYPHIATELLTDADDRDLLVGIVDTKDCEHTEVWTIIKKGEDDVRVCGTCMMEMNDELLLKDT